MTKKPRVVRKLALEWSFDELSRSFVCGAWTVAVNAEGRFLVFRDGAVYTRTRKGVSNVPSFRTQHAAQLYAEARITAKRGGRPKGAISGKNVSMKLASAEIEQIKAAFPNVPLSAALRSLLTPVLVALPAAPTSAPETAQAAS